jgi:hypothetical protein
MSKTVKIPATPLVESKSNLGRFKDTPRVLGESDGSFGHHVGVADTETRQTVNGVTYVMPADPRKT